MRSKFYERYKGGLNLLRKSILDNGKGKTFEQKIVHEDYILEFSHYLDIVRESFRELQKDNPTTVSLFGMVEANENNKEGKTYNLDNIALHSLLEALAKICFICVSENYRNIDFEKNYEYLIELLSNEAVKDEEKRMPLMFPKTQQFFNVNHFYETCMALVWDGTLNMSKNESKRDANLLINCEGFFYQCVALWGKRKSDHYINFFQKKFGN